MDELGPLNIEFLINNPEVIAQARQVESTLQGVNDDVQQSAAIAGNTILVNMKRVEAELVAQRQRLASNTDPYNVGTITNQIKNLEDRLTSLKRQNETAVTSFTDVNRAVKEVNTTVTEVPDKVGKFQAAIERVTNVQNIGARVVTQFTRQIIGLGTAFLSGIVGAKAIEALITYISNLDVFTGRLDQAKQNMLALNDVMANADKDAGKQVASLKLLYDTATNANNSIKDRIAAAEQLRETYPAEFANASKLAIINGQLKGSYDELTSSILTNAKSHAARTKIDELSGANLDAQFEIDKNNLAKAEGIAKAYDNYKKQLANQNAQSAAANAQGLSTYKGSGGTFATPIGQLKNEIALFTQTANRENLPFEQTLGVNNGVMKRLTDYITDISKGTDALKNANKLLGDNLQNFDNLLANQGGKTDLENIKNALQVKLNALTPSDSQFQTIKNDLQKVDDLIKQYDVKATNTNAAEEALKRRAALLQEIANAVSTVNDKQLSKDQQALTAISDKFDLLKQKIATFNADPKNKNAQIGAGVTAALNKDENTAVDNQANLNENNYIQQDIDKKKKLYADYEAYRRKVGKDAADAEYQDLLLSGSDFATYLNNLNNSIDKNDQSGAIQQRTELVKKAQLQNLEDQKKSLETLLESVKTFETERTELTATYEDKRQQLLKAGKIEEAAQLEIQYKQELGQLNDSNVEKIDAVKELLRGVGDLSIQQAKQVIATVTDLLAKANGLTDAEIAKLKGALAKANKEIIKDAIGDGLIQAGQGLQQIGQEISVVNASFGNTVKAVGDVAVAIGEMNKAYEAYSAAVKAEKAAQTAANMTAEITSVIGLVVLAIQLIVEATIAVFTMFSSAHKSAVQAAKDMQAYQDSLITGQIKYNELLRQQALAQGDITKMTIEELQAREQLIATQKEQAQADYNTLLNKIQSTGTQVTGEHTEKYGGFLGIAKKTKVVQDLAGLSGADYDTLEKLYTEGKLTDSTKAWFEQLQTVKQEMDGIGVSASDVLNQLNQDATGTTAMDIANAIVDGFKQGKRTAADFADNFQQLMQNAALSVFENDYLTSKINDFYAQFAAASAAPGGLTPDKIAELKQKYSDIITNAGQQVTQLEKVVGPINSGSTGSPNSLTGAIKGMTEDQANLLAGQFGGLRITQLETNQILSTNMALQLAEMRNSTLLQRQLVANSGRTADAVESHTSILKDISRNTSSDSLISVLRAAGKN